jgi:hypothetical protein
MVDADATDGKTNNEDRPMINIPSRFIPTSRIS